jgi:hypothetical protein
MVGFTNKALQSKEKVFQSLFGFDESLGKSFLTLRRISSLSPSMVISPSTKSLIWGWNGTPIPWSPS